MFLLAGGVMAPPTHLVRSTAGGLGGPAAVSAFLYPANQRHQRRFYTRRNLNRLPPCWTSNPPSQGRISPSQIRLSSNGRTPDLSNPLSEAKSLVQIMKESIHQLREAQVDEPEESVFQIMACVLDLDWDTGFREIRQLYFDHTPSINSYDLTHEQIQTFQSLLERRGKHEPLQYIVGQWDFFEDTFVILAPLLCPRPETEELVELVLQETLKPELKRLHGRQAYRVLDIGCGTGCIGISLVAHMLRQRSKSLLPISRHDQPSTEGQASVHVTAIDIDPVAVATSQENAARILGDDWDTHYQVQLVGAADFHITENEAGFDLIVSNPPYILPADMKSLDTTVLQYENHKALCGGTSADGLDVVRQIVHQLKHWCRPGASCWMEVDPTQPELLKKWLKKGTSANDGFESEPTVDFNQMQLDMAGRERFVQLRV